MSRTIPLTRGYVAIVDDEDYEWLSQFSWRVWIGPNNKYAVRSEYTRGAGRGSKIGYFRMHREILGLSGDDASEVDHVNGDGLDNRRANLRVCSRSQNMTNVRKAPGKSSRYKGVSWHKGIGKWTAQIQVGGKLRYLGAFVSEEDAARAYDEAAVGAWGERARPNFPRESA